VRIVTDLDGKLTAITGTANAPIEARLTLPDGKNRKIQLQPNETQPL
jgi:hypothetical protein